MTSGTARDPWDHKVNPYASENVARLIAEVDAECDEGKDAKYERQRAARVKANEARLIAKRRERERKRELAEQAAVSQNT